MKPGRNMDRRVACVIFGMTERDFVSGPTGFAPPYSTDIAAAWQIVQKLAPLVGDFPEADGFFILKYADSADHGNEDGTCDPGPIVADESEDNDLERWSAHFHPGCPGAGSESAKLWNMDSKRTCARGETAAHAICRAALRLYGVDA